MEQHAVPQNISSYQFHLVGDMTLKQFLELAGGVVVGVIFYATGLPSIIKWPLILISAGLGAALAFVPLEERPLEQWIVAFIRGIYSPTLFHWEKREGVEYFQDEGAAQPTTPSAPSTSMLSKIPFLSKLEEGENSYLSKLSGLLGNPVTTTYQQPTPVTPVPANEGTVLTVNTGSHPLPPTNEMRIPETPAGLKDLKVPQTTYISLNKTARPHVVVEEEAKPTPPVDLKTVEVKQTLPEQKIENAQEAKFSVDAAPPSVPTINNTISGQVMDANKKIIEGAVLTILDDAGRSVRAMRTNRAGHFLNVTALLPGKYKILTEKEGYNFDPVEFETNDSIIQPIAIQARLGSSVANGQMQ